MKYYLIAAIVGFTISCNFITSNNSEIIVEVVPTAATYTYTDTSRFYFSINNLSDQTIYYSTCIEPVLKKKTQTTFKSLPPSGIVCECICLVRISPIENDTLVIKSNWILSRNQNKRDFVQGEYRLFPTLFYDDNFRQQIDHDQIKSSTFEIINP